MVFASSFFSSSRMEAPMSRPLTKGFLLTRSKPCAILMSGALVRQITISRGKASAAILSIWMFSISPSGASAIASISGTSCCANATCDFGQRRVKVSGSVTTPRAVLLNCSVMRAMLRVSAPRKA
jgi:hypothetical protein